MQASLGEPPRASLGDRLRGSLVDLRDNLAARLRDSLVVGKGNLVSFLSLQHAAHTC